jgi:hypothetical protein
LYGDQGEQTHSSSAVRLSERGRFNETDRQLWGSAALPIEVAEEMGITSPVSPGLLFGCLMPLRFDFDTIGLCSTSTHKARSPRFALNSAPAYICPVLRPAKNSQITQAGTLQWS